MSQKAKRIAKRTAVIFLIAAMLISASPLTEYGNGFTATVSAAEIQSDGDFEYQTLDDGISVEILKYNGTDTELSIPQLINGKEVKRIGDGAFSHCENLTAVTIADGLTDIGFGAFLNCTSLESIAIPDSVETIGSNAFSMCEALSSISLPQNLTAIEQEAFRGCENLESITLPNGIKTIGYQAFANCTNLKDISIPGNVIFVGKDAFFNTPWYNNQPDGMIYIGKTAYKYKGEMPQNTSVTLRDETVTISSGAFENFNGLADINIPSSVENIESNAFYGCTGLENITIPDSVKSIGANAFYGCENLKDAVLSQNITVIEQGMFGGCTSLENITFPNGVKKVASDAICDTPWYNNQPDGLVYVGKTAYKYRGEMPQNTSITLKDGTVTISSRAFEDCANLADITIPNSVKEIEYGAFYGCAGLKNVTIPDSVTDIGASAFSGCVSLSSVSLSANITDIKEETFSGCTSLEGIEIPSGVKKLKDLAFYGCASLGNITIPDSVTEIGSLTFSGCTGLKSMNIPNGVESIGYSAFIGCTGLAEITIADSVEKIGANAFSGCESLTVVKLSENIKNLSEGLFKDCKMLGSVTIPSNAESIGKNAFSGCESLTVIDIPKGVASIGDNMFDGCINLREINVSQDNESYSSADGVLFDKSRTQLISYPKSKIYESYSLPSSVQGISDFAFDGCMKLKNITLPSGVTDIGSYAFIDCKSLESINLPDGVKSLCNGVFYNCSNLKSIDIPGGVTDIGDYAFYNCSSIESITIPSTIRSMGNSAFSDCTALKSVSLPTEVIGTDDEAPSISYKLFYNCISLESITIPSGVKNISEKAFGNCTALKSITFPDSAEYINMYALDGCENIEAINVGENNEIYSSQDGVLFDKEKTLLINYPEGKTDKTYNVPNGVVSIGEGAFRNNKSIENINLPFGVRNIEYHAFCACSNLKSIEFPENIMFIGYYAFLDCDSLSDIYVVGRASVWKIAKIGEYGNDSFSNAALHYIPKDASCFTFYKISDKTYTGKAITPTVTVKDGDSTLKKGTDYTVSYENNTNAGTATVIVTGIGDYTGTSSATFNIVPVNISQFSIDQISNQTYTGKAITPTVNVKDGNSTLKNGTDYTVSYKNNINAGTATVTVTGKGNYTGTKTATFKILPISTSKLTVSGIANKTYTGKAITQSVTVKNGTMTLKNGTDYTVSYKSNINVGTATVTITGKGNYTGTKTATFKIVAPTVAKPTNLKATQTASTVKLTWSKVSGADSYGVYVYNIKTQTYKGLATVTGTSYTVKNLTAGTTYKFVVRTNKKVGSTTFHSSNTAITTATKPANVKNLKATQTTNSVKLSWSKVSGATSYDVYQKVSGKWKKVATTTSASYTVKNLKAGTTYDFAVRANKVVGKTTYNGAFTFITTATKTAIPTMTVKAGSKRATVTWKKVSGATGYEVLMSTSKNSGYKKVAAVSASKTAKYTKTGLTKGKTYYFRVRTYKTVGGTKIYSGYQTKSVKIK